MDSELKNKLFYELLWLIGVLIVSAVLEFIIIVSFDLHPILTVKIQGLIGLMIIAYGVRMIGRMGKRGMITFSDEDDDPKNGEQQIQPN